MNNNLTAQKIEQLLALYNQGQRNFKGFTLNQANLAQVKLPLIVMEDANLEAINFEQANLMGANLNRSNLKNANFKSANLMGADLVKVDLENSNLSKALISGVNLSASNLCNCDLGGASFVGSDLTAADLRGANLKGTNLRGANLRGTNLTETNIDYAIVDYDDLKNAIIPEQLRDKILSLQEEIPDIEVDQGLNESIDDEDQSHDFLIENNDNNAEQTEINQAQFFENQNQIETNQIDTDIIYDSYLSEVETDSKSDDLSNYSPFLEMDNSEWFENEDQEDHAVIFGHNLDQSNDSQENTQVNQEIPSNQIEDQPLSNILDDYQWFNDSEENQMIEITEPFLEMPENDQNSIFKDKDRANLDNLDNQENRESGEMFETILPDNSDQEWLNDSEEIKIETLEISDPFLEEMPNKSPENLTFDHNLSEQKSEQNLDSLLEIPDQSSENMELGNILESIVTNDRGWLNDSEEIKIETLGNVESLESLDNLDNLEISDLFLQSASNQEQKPIIYAQSWEENELDQLLAEDLILSHESYDLDREINDLFNLGSEKKETLTKETLIDEDELKLSSVLTDNEENQTLIFSFDEDNEGDIFTQENEENQTLTKATLVDEDNIFDLSIGLNNEIDSLTTEEETIKNISVFDNNNKPTLILEDNPNELQKISETQNELLELTENQVIIEQFESIEKEEKSEDLPLILPDDLATETNLFVAENEGEEKQTLTKETLIDLDINSQDLPAILPDDLETETNPFFLENETENDNYDHFFESESEEKETLSKETLIDFNTDNEDLANILSRDLDIETNPFFTENESANSDHLFELENQLSGKIEEDQHLSPEQIAKFNQFSDSIIEDQEEKLTQSQSNFESEITAQNEENESNTAIERRRINQSKSTFIQKLNNPVIESIQSVLKNRLQYHFKKNVFEYYQNQCAITQCNILPLLEVVMINPSAQEMPDHPSNGLVLRRDLSVLFQLFLLAINPDDLTVLVSPTIKNKEYQALNGQKILISNLPNNRSLVAHLKNCSWHQSNLTNLGQKSLKNQPLSKQIKVKKANDFDNLKTYLIAQSQQPRWLTFGLVGITAFSIIGAFLFNYFGGNKESEVISSTQNLKPIDVTIGDLTYESNGLIDNNNTYFSLPVLNHLGLNSGKIKPEANKINLEFSGKFKIKFVDLKIKDETFKNQGLIIEKTGISYIPINLIKSLKIKSSNLVENQTITYQNITYIKTGELKRLGVKIGWDEKSRILTLQ